MCKDRKYFNTEEIISYFEPDLSGKVVIVTNAQFHVGKETAQMLALVYAKVIIACRTLEIARNVVKDIRKTVSNASLIPMELDLSSMMSIEKFSSTFLAFGLPLHLLVNNASILEYDQLFTEDGFEANFAISYLGHYFLTLQLLNKLKSSAPARIINVSSCSSYLFETEKGIDFDSLTDVTAYNYFNALMQAKLAGILHAKELQRRFDKEDINVIATSVQPNVTTNKWKRYMTSYSFRKAVNTTRGLSVLVWPRLFSGPDSAGASTVLYCAVAPKVAKGEYYARNVVERKLINQHMNDKELAMKLWDFSETRSNGLLFREITRNCQ
ncbi:hypothetical protein BD560DRAFT_402980 [Blakeslea trispora]|nr:hypothetical protein BD560DRAFT_402980 [Blakeslea trispora]